MRTQTFVLVICVLLLSAHFISAHSDKDKDKKDKKDGKKDKSLQPGGAPAALPAAGGLGKSKIKAADNGKQKATGNAVGAVSNKVGARFYVSFHSKESNIWSYDFQGNVITQGILKSTAGTTLQSLRGMYLNADGTMLQINAYKTDSNIHTFGKCEGGIRTQTGTFATKGLSHPYAMTKDNGGNLYANNQDTYNLVKYSPSGNFLGILKTWGPNDEIRGIAHDSKTDNIFVSNKQVGVLVYNAHASTWNPNPIPVKGVISIYVDAASRMMWMGSSHDDTVYQFNADTLKQVAKFSDKNLKHPAGLVMASGTLYVLSQGTQSLVAFDAKNGKFNGVVIKKFPDAPEQLVISSC